MNAETIRAWFEYLAVCFAYAGGAMFLVLAFVWLFDQWIAKMLRYFQAWDCVIEFIIHRREFEKWLEARREEQRTAK